MMNGLMVWGCDWFRWCFCNYGMTMLVLWVYVILAAMVDDAGLAQAPLFIQVSACLGA